MKLDYDQLIFVRLAMGVSYNSIAAIHFKKAYAVGVEEEEEVILQYP